MAKLMFWLMRVSLALHTRWMKDLLNSKQQLMMVILPGIVSILQLYLWKSRSILLHICIVFMNSQRHVYELWNFCGDSVCQPCRSHITWRQKFRNMLNATYSREGKLYCYGCSEMRFALQVIILYILIFTALIFCQYFIECLLYWRVEHEFYSNEFLGQRRS